MSENIVIKNLGPILEARIEPRPLTVLIGPQASGKSLVAQSLYFFRTLRSKMARKFVPGMAETNGWQNNVIREILDALRGVPFGYFANGAARLAYSSDEHKKELGVTVYYSNRIAKVNQTLERMMGRLIKAWDEDPLELGKARNIIARPEIFIPTERSMFTRMMEREPGILFDDHIQPETVIQFANFLIMARHLYQTAYHSKHHVELFNYFIDSQKRALRGFAYVPKTGKQQWKWRVVDDADDISHGSAEKERKKAKIVPIEATASGQMEAWPFFAIAATYGVRTDDASFYFEEPETHLHPGAQVEVVKAIAKLVNNGRRMLITTHSPFILYLINNMMLNFLSVSAAKNNDDCLDPTLVTAYRMQNGKAVKIIDHDDDEPLINSEELDKISDQLGAEFDEILDRLDSQK